MNANRTPHVIRRGLEGTGEGTQRLCDAFGMRVIGCGIVLVIALLVGCSTTNSGDLASGDAVRAGDTGAPADGASGDASQPDGGRPDGTPADLSPPPIDAQVRDLTLPVVFLPPPVDAQVRDIGLPDVLWPPPVDAQVQDLALPDVPWLPPVDAQVPDLVLPDVLWPDIAWPPPWVDAAMPDAAEPDAALPDAAGPDAAEPDATSPDAALPDAISPDAALPDAALPDAAEPDAARPPETCPDGLWGLFCDHPCDCDDGLVCTGIEVCDRLAGCLAGEPPVLDDHDACTLDTCNEGLGLVEHTLDVTQPACAPRRPVPTVDVLDYGFWYWPGNHRPVETWPRVEPEMHFLTGHYGFSFDEATGDLGRFGAFESPADVSRAATLDRSVVDALPPADLRFEAGADAANVRADGILGANASVINRARLIDGGRFMNRIEIPSVGYSANGAYAGRVEIASMPRHVVFNHTVSSSGWNIGVVARARVVLSGAALAGLPDATWLAPGRALRLTGPDGEGWVFVVYSTPERPTTLTYADGALAAETTARVAAGTPLTASLLAFPTAAAGPAQTSMYLDPVAAATVGYRLLNRDGQVRGAYDVAWDPTLGAYRVPLEPINVAGDPSQTAAFDANPSMHNLYGRHELTIDTHGVSGISVPLAMFGPEKLSLYITGGAPSLRDVDGQPNGVPVQISKNWHAPPNWYHFYAQPTPPGEAPYTMELTVASSRWGRDAYAASHAQLSLIGWNDAGGRWDESALGVFGESVTYDPDVALNRAMVDDVRPFLVLANRKWLWTGNVGGADFLRYVTAAEPQWQRRLSRVRTLVDAGGPNLTDVEYAGVSTDGRIEGRIRTQLGRTDDLVRVYYHLDYTFLQDVRYERLAFFQMAADNYGDNGFTRYAYGNEAGVMADAAVPAVAATGYASDDARGIALPGVAPWVMLYANSWNAAPLPENLGNVGFVVRHFEADVGGTRLTTPHINLNRTNNGNPQIAFELGLPFEAGAAWCGAPCLGDARAIPAGSRVRATVEYLVPPAVKAAYYGTGAFLAGFPAEHFDTPEIMRALAAGNALTVEALVGAVRRIAPVEIDAVAAPVAAEFVLSGGIGYTPLSFHGLVRHDGWRLQRLEGDAWQDVDQSVIGNDFWQARHVPETDTYTLTYNVQNTRPTRYRLVWVP